MASCITSQYGSVKSYCPQMRLTVTQQSTTATTVTFAYKVEYVVHGYAAYTNGVARKWSIKIDGKTVDSGSYNINGKTSTVTVTGGTGTYTVNKTTSSRNVSFSVTFDIDLTWGSTHKDTVSASGSIGISAKTSYAVKYNANGGSGAPSSQTKWYGTTLKLSSTKPTRTGYIFQGWGTSAGDTSVNYAAGANYTANAAITLYAIWKIITYTVTFNANGGTGGPTTATKSYGQTLTLPTTKPTRTNYNFLGWATSATSDVVAYAAGGSYTQNAAITLYAVWELAWIAPKITNFTVDRCTQDGTLQEDGTYALVKFNWAIDSVNSGGLTSVVIGYKLETAADYTNTTVVSGGTKYSDSVSKVIGGGAIETEYNYDIRVVVTDKKGNSVSVLSLPSMFYIMDFLMGGKGVAFGKPAANKAFEVALPSVFEDTMRVEGVAAFKSNITSSANGITSFINIQKLPVGTDFNTVTTPGTYLGDGKTNEYTNGPAYDIDATFILNVLPSGPEGQLNQEIYASSKNWPVKLHRSYYSDAWGSWQPFVKGGLRQLWAGVYYMTETHTITLAEPVSAQQNGIVLIFSAYTSGAAQNYDYCSLFVPKGQVNAHPGAGITATLFTGGFGQIGAKYLYVNDTTITGNTRNDQTGTSNGVTYNNKYWVLRSVWGA